MKFSEAKDLLDRFGINYSTNEKEKSFDRVDLPFDPLDWCSLCQTSGSNYIGGCCSQMSYVQDILNGWFRDGGQWINIREISELMDLMLDHTENWFIPEKVEAKLENLSKEEFTNSAPWDKIIGLWIIVKDHYKPRKLVTPHEDSPPIKEAIHTVEQTTRWLSWEHLFHEEKTSQNYANTTMVLYRLAPSLKYLYENLCELDVGPLEGFAIYSTKTKYICSNRAGLCIFKTKEKAEELLELFHKYSSEEDTFLDELTLRPVRVSLEEGCLFTDTGEKYPND